METKKDACFCVIDFIFKNGDIVHSLLNKKVELATLKRIERIKGTTKPLLKVGNKIYQGLELESFKIQDVKPYNEGESIAISEFSEGK